MILVQTTADLGPLLGANLGTLLAPNPTQMQYEGETYHLLVGCVLVVLEVLVVKGLLKVKILSLEHRGTKAKRIVTQRSHLEEWAEKKKLSQPSRMT